MSPSESNQAMYVDRPTMARLLSIGLRTLDEHRKCGRIPSYKFAGRRLYHPDEVRQALASFREGQ